MIGAPEKGKTIRKVVNIPDDLAREIDENAIGFYTSRSEFVSEAIRNLTRKRLREDRDYAEKLMKEHDNFDEVSELLVKESQEKFFFLMRDTDCRRSESMTPVTVYIPEIEMSYIDNFVGPDMAIRNFQEYSRLAATLSIDSLKREMEIAFELGIEDIGGRPTLTVTWKN